MLSLTRRVEAIQLGPRDSRRLGPSASQCANFRIRPRNPAISPRRIANREPRKLFSRYPRRQLAELAVLHVVTVLEFAPAQLGTNAFTIRISESRCEVAISCFGFVWEIKSYVQLREGVATYQDIGYDVEQFCIERAALKRLLSGLWRDPVGLDRQT